MRETKTMMIKHYVTFYSPGTFVSETSDFEVDSWEVDEAVRLSRGVRERYGATPYGFRFSTRTRGDDMDSKLSSRSPMHWLGGRIETISEIEARRDPKDLVLLENMRSNGWDRIVVNDNSWRFVGPLMEDDVVLEYEP